MPVASPGIVLVTGGSNYIAGFCIAQLLLDGWHVRTTVRSLAKADQVRASIAKISAGAPSIEFFEADLNSDQGWDRAVAGIDYVLHVASPVTAIDPKSDNELVRPARDGALRVLNLPRSERENLESDLHGEGKRLFFEVPHGRPPKGPTSPHETAQLAQALLIGRQALDDGTPASP